MFSIRYLPAAGYQRVRWVNEGGWTHEIARFPEGQANFDWRLSQADVDDDGPFSRFEGCERELIVLSGGVRLSLTDPEESVDLVLPLDSHRFAGDRAVHAKVTQRPMRDLNIIWRIGRCNVIVRTIDVTGKVPLTIGEGDTLLIYVKGGECSVKSATGSATEVFRLATNDTLMATLSGNRKHTLGVAGASQIITVRISPA